MNRLHASVSKGLIVAGALGALANVSAGQQQRGQFHTTVEVDMQYLLFLPKAYDTKASWPLIVFLHGAGERGDDLELVKKHGPPKIVENQPDFPFIVLSPQARSRWQSDVLSALIDDVMAHHKVDPRRVYLTGLSMGGFGTLALAAEHPEKFAAIAPICGGGDTKLAAKFKSLPTWIFHGAKDLIVPVQNSQDMYDAIQTAGGNVKLTIYPDAEHDSWTETYDNPQLYEWFLSHSR